MESSIIIPVIVINVAAVAVMVAVAVSSRAPLPAAVSAVTATRAAPAGPPSAKRTISPPATAKALPEGVSQLRLGASGKSADLFTLSLALPLSSFSQGMESTVTEAVFGAIDKADVKGIPLIISRGKLVDLGLAPPQGTDDGAQAEAHALELMVGVVVIADDAPLKFFVVVVSSTVGPRLVRAALAGWVAASQTLRDFTQVKGALALLRSVLTVAVPIRMLNLFADDKRTDKFALALVQQSASGSLDTSVVDAASRLESVLQGAFVVPAQRRPLSDAEKAAYTCDNVAPIFACTCSRPGVSGLLLLLQYPSFSRMVNTSSQSASSGKRPDMQGASIGTIVEAGASAMIDPPASVWVEGSVRKVANYVSDADARLITGKA